MSDIVCCKDCIYSAPSNLAGNFAELSNLVYCTYYKHNISIIRGCGNGKPKLKTNADRIRWKDDDGLADFFYNEAFLAPWCDMSCGDVEELPCRQCILEWLKQECAE